MALIKLHTGVQTGDFIRRYGHNISADQKWWKVLDITGPRKDRLVVVDRHGYKREFPWTQGRKYKVWEPGDPRTDGDNI